MKLRNSLQRGRCHRDNADDMAGAILCHPHKIRSDEWQGYSGEGIVRSMNASSYPACIVARTQRRVRSRCSSGLASRTVKISTVPPFLSYMLAQLSIA